MNKREPHVGGKGRPYGYLSRRRAFNKWDYAIIQIGNPIFVPKGTRIFKSVRKTYKPYITKRACIMYVYHDRPLKNDQIPMGYVSVSRDSPWERNQRYTHYYWNYHDMNNGIARAWQKGFKYDYLRTWTYLRSINLDKLYSTSTARKFKMPFDAKRKFRDRLGETEGTGTDECVSRHDEL